MYISRNITILVSILLLSIFCNLVIAKNEPLTKRLRCGLCVAAVETMENKILGFDREKGDIVADTKFRLDEKHIENFNKKIKLSRSEAKLYDFLRETQTQFLDGSDWGILNSSKYLSLHKVGADDKRIQFNKTNTKAIKYVFSQWMEEEDFILNTLKTSTGVDNAVEKICLKMLKWCPGTTTAPVDFGECFDEYPKPPAPEPTANATNSTADPLLNIEVDSTPINYIPEVIPEPDVLNSTTEIIDTVANTTTDTTINVTSTDSTTKDEL